MHASLGVLLQEAAALLQQVTVEVVKNDDPLVISAGLTLQPLLIPTPRWPDLMAVYEPTSKLLFSSEMFAAHIAPGMVGPEVSRSVTAGRKNVTKVK